MRELIENILSCSSDPKNWERSLDSFNREFGITASCMFSVHEFDSNNMNMAFSQYFHENLTPELRDAVENGGDSDDDAAYQALFRLPAPQLYDERAILGVASYEELPPSEVRRMTAEMGLHRRVAAALNKTGPWIDGFFTQQKTEQECQNFLADTRTEFVLPIMANSIALGRTLQALHARFSQSLNVLGKLGLGVFLVDQSGCVVEHNEEAQRILDSADGITMTSTKRLTLFGPDSNRELNAMIATANGITRGEIAEDHTFMAAERPSGDYEYLLSVRPLSDGLAELEAGLKCAFVTVVDPTRRNVLSGEGLAALGQLSEAEQEVVALLIQGLRPAAVAEQRDVSLNTTKTQLRTISQKLRCTSQNDIIRMAAATRIPIDAAE